MFGRFLNGTKDGNVWGRLLGYTRSHWSRFLRVDQETSSYIRSLPEEAWGAGQRAPTPSLVDFHKCYMIHDWYMTVSMFYGFRCFGAKMALFLGTNLA